MYFTSAKKCYKTKVNILNRSFRNYFIRNKILNLNFNHSFNDKHEIIK